MVHAIRIGLGRLALLLLLAALHDQGKSQIISGTISGTIVDPSDAAIVGASVVAIAAIAGAIQFIVTRPYM